MILLIHEERQYGMVALAEGTIAGEHTPERRAVHDGKYILLQSPAHAQEHDVQELARLGYRLATPKEQEQFVTARRKKSTLTEKEQ